MEHGVFPDKLKVGLLKPIYKKGDRSLISNYRPITLLSNVAKIFEKILLKRYKNFLELHNVITPKQSSYQTNKSTSTTIFQILQRILDSINKSEAVVAVFLDLSKAFDSVQHDRLLEKSEKVGFRGRAGELLASYLSNRQQITSLQNANGSFTKSQCGKILRGFRRVPSWVRYFFCFI